MLLSEYRKNYLVKIISSVLIITFLAQDIVWAGGDEVVRPGTSINLPAPSNIAEEINIPNNVAHVRDRYLSDSGETIINIQDAHASLGAQKSIAKILEDLVSRYDLRFIALEGSSGRIDTSLLKSFPDEKIRRLTGERLMAEGKMSAGEFFSLISDKPVRIYGVEDDGDYRHNVQLFSELNDIRGALQGDMEGLTATVRMLEKAVYPEDLLTLKSLSLSSGERKESFAGSWNILSGLADKYGVSISGDNIRLLDGALKSEGSIDFKAAESQRSFLAGMLTRKLDKNGIEGLIAKSMALKSGEISQGAYYAFLKEAAMNEGLDLSRYPDLIRYGEYIVLYESIDFVALFKEIDDLERSLAGRMLKTDDQKDLYRLSDRISMIGEILDARMMPGRYGASKDILSALRPEDISGTIERIASGHNIRLFRAYNADNIISALPRALEFYVAAEKRNELLFANTISRMRESGERIAALITGGYHTEGIERISKKRDTSYVVMLPRFDPAEKDRPYVAILTNKTDGYKELIDSGDYHVAIWAYFNGIGKIGGRSELELRDEAFRFTLKEAIEGMRAEVLNDEPIVREKTAALIGMWIRNYSKLYEAENLAARREGLHPIEPELFREYLVSLAGELGVTQLTIDSLSDHGDSEHGTLPGEDIGQKRVPPGRTSAFGRWLQRNIEDEWLAKLDGRQIEGLSKIFQNKRKIAKMIFSKMALAAYIYILADRGLFIASQSGMSWPFVVVTVTAYIAILLGTLLTHEAGHLAAAKKIDRISRKEGAPKIKKSVISLFTRSSTGLAMTAISLNGAFALTPKETVSIYRSAALMNLMNALAGTMVMGILRSLPGHYPVVSEIVIIWSVLNAMIVADYILHRFILSSYHDGTLTRTISAAERLFRNGILRDYPGIGTLLSIDMDTPGKIFVRTSSGVYYIRRERDWAREGRNSPEDHLPDIVFRASDIQKNADPDIFVEFMVSGELMVAASGERSIKYGREGYALYRITGLPDELLYCAQAEENEGVPAERSSTRAASFTAAGRMLKRIFSSIARNWMPISIAVLSAAMSQVGGEVGLEKIIIASIAAYLMGAAIQFALDRLYARHEGAIFKTVGDLLGVDIKPTQGVAAPDPEAAAVLADDEETAVSDRPGFFRLFGLYFRQFRINRLYGLTQIGELIANPLFWIFLISIQYSLSSMAQDLMVFVFAVAIFETVYQIISILMTPGAYKKVDSLRSLENTRRIHEARRGDKAEREYQTYKDLRGERRRVGTAQMATALAIAMGYVVLIVHGNALKSGATNVMLGGVSSWALLCGTLVMIMVANAVRDSLQISNSRGIWEAGIRHNEKAPADIRDNCWSIVGAANFIFIICQIIGMSAGWALQSNHPISINGKEYFYPFIASGDFTWAILAMLFLYAISKTIAVWYGTPYDTILTITSPGTDYRVEIVNEGGARKRYFVFGGELGMKISFTGPEDMKPIRDGKNRWIVPDPDVYGAEICYSRSCEVRDSADSPIGSIWRRAHPEKRVWELPGIKIVRHAGPEAGCEVNEYAYVDGMRYVFTSARTGKEVRGIAEKADAATSDTGRMTPLCDFDVIEISRENIGAGLLNAIDTDPGHRALKNDIYAFASGCADPKIKLCAVYHPDEIGKDRLDAVLFVRRETSGRWFWKKDVTVILSRRFGGPGELPLEELISADMRDVVVMERDVSDQTEEALPFHKRADYSTAPGPVANSVKDALDEFSLFLRGEDTKPVYYKNTIPSIRDQAAVYADFFKRSRRSENAFFIPGEIHWLVLSMLSGVASVFVVLPINFLGESLKEFALYITLFSAANFLISVLFTYISCKIADHVKRLDDIEDGGASDRLLLKYWYISAGIKIAATVTNYLLLSAVFHSTEGAVLAGGYYLGIYISLGALSSVEQGLIHMVWFRMGERELRRETDKNDRFYSGWGFGTSLNNLLSLIAKAVSFAVFYRYIVIDPAGSGITIQPSAAGTVFTVGVVILVSALLPRFLMLMHKKFSVMTPGKTAPPSENMVDHDEDRPESAALSILTLTYDITKRGGVQIYVDNLIKAITRIADARILLIFPVLTEEDDQDGPEYGNSGSITHQAVHERPGRWARSSPITALNYYRLLSDILAHQSVDVIHFHGGGVAARVAARLVARRFNVPMVVTRHFVHTWRWNNPLNMIATFVGTILLLGNITILGVTEAARPKGPYRYHVIGAGVDTEFFRREYGDAGKFRKKYGLDDRKIVFYPARLIRSKGQLDLLDLAQEMKRVDSDSQVVIMGPENEPDYAVQLKEEMGKRGLEDYVSMLPAGGPEDIRDGLAASEVMAFPSYDDALGLIALEAASMEVPVVAYSTGGIPEAVKDNETGILVPTGDKRSLISEIMALLGSDERRAELGSAGRRFVETHYSLSALAQKHVDLYLNLKKRVDIEAPLRLGAAGPFRNDDTTEPDRDAGRGVSDEDLSRYCPAFGGRPVRFRTDSYPGVFEIATVPLHQEHGHPNIWRIEARYKGRNGRQNILAGYLGGTIIIGPRDISTGWLRTINYEAIRREAKEALIKIDPKLPLEAVFDNHTGKLKLVPPGSRLSNMDFDLNREVALLRLSGMRMSRAIRSVIRSGENFENGEIAAAIWEFMSSLLPPDTNVGFSLKHPFTREQIENGVRWEDTIFGKQHAAVGLGHVFTTLDMDGDEPEILLRKGEPQKAPAYIHRPVYWIDHERLGPYGYVAPHGSTAAPGHIQSLSQDARAPKELASIIGELREHRERLTQITSENLREIEAIISDRIEAFEKTTTDPPEELRQALANLSNIVRSNNIHSFKAIVYGKEDYALGYGRENEIGLAEEMFSLDPELLAEALFHEAICPILGHQPSRKIQEDIFPDNYIIDEHGNKKSLLQKELRKIIDYGAGKSEALSRSIALLDSISREGILSPFGLMERGIRMHGSADHEAPIMSLVNQISTNLLVVSGDATADGATVNKSLFDSQFGSLAVMAERAEAYNAMLTPEIVSERLLSSVMILVDPDKLPDRSAMTMELFAERIAEPGIYGIEVHGNIPVDAIKAMLVPEAYAAHASERFPDVEIITVGNTAGNISAWLSSGRMGLHEETFEGVSMPAYEDALNGYIKRLKPGERIMMHGVRLVAASDIMMEGNSPAGEAFGLSLSGGQEIYESPVSKEVYHLSPDSFYYGPGYKGAGVNLIDLLTEACNIYNEDSLGRGPAAKVIVPSGELRNMYLHAEDGSIYFDWDMVPNFDVSVLFEDYYDGASDVDEVYENAVRELSGIAISTAERYGLKLKSVPSENHTSGIFLPVRVRRGGFFNIKFNMNSASINSLLETEDEQAYIGVFPYFPIETGRDEFNEIFNAVSSGGSSEDARERLSADLRDRVVLSRQAVFVDKDPSLASSDEILRVLRNALFLCDLNKSGDGLHDAIVLLIGEYQDKIDTRPRLSAADIGKIDGVLLKLLQIQPEDVSHIAFPDEDESVPASDDMGDGFIRSGMPDARSARELEKMRADRQGLDRAHIAVVAGLADITGSCIGRFEELLDEIEDTGIRQTYEGYLREARAAQRKIAIRGHVYSFSAIVHGEDDYALGYGNDEEMALAEEVLQLDPRLAAEALFHEALCYRLGHEEARRIQEAIFADNYMESKGARKGLLQTELRRIIDVLAYGYGAGEYENGLEQALHISALCEELNGCYIAISEVLLRELAALKNGQEGVTEGSLRRAMARAVDEVFAIVGMIEEINIEIAILNNSPDLYARMTESDAAGANLCAFINGCVFAALDMAGYNAVPEVTRRSGFIHSYTYTIIPSDQAEEIVIDVTLGQFIPEYRNVIAVMSKREYEDLLAGAMDGLSSLHSVAGRGIRAHASMKSFERDRPSALQSLRDDPNSGKRRSAAIRILRYPMSYAAMTGLAAAAVDMSANFARRLADFIIDSMGPKLTEIEERPSESAEMPAPDYASTRPASHFDQDRVNALLLEAAASDGGAVRESALAELVELAGTDVRAYSAMHRIFTDTKNIKLRGSRKTAVAVAILSVIESADPKHDKPPKASSRLYYEASKWIIDDLVASIHFNDENGVVSARARIERFGLEGLVDPIEDIKAYDRERGVIWHEMPHVIRAMAAMCAENPELKELLGEEMKKLERDFKVIINASVKVFKHRISGLGRNLSRPKVARMIQRSKDDMFNQLLDTFGSRRAKLDSISEMTGQDAFAALKTMRRLFAFAEKRLLSYQRDPDDTTGSPEKFDLAELVKECAGYFTHNEDVVINVEAPDIPVIVRMDEVFALEVVMNLLKNAVKAMPGERGRIDIAVRTEAGSGVVSISDTGRGITDDVRDRMFEEGFTASSGTGLGLYLCRRYLEAAGGMIDGGNRTDGVQGAVFVISLPLSETQASQSSEMPETLGDVSLGDTPPGTSDPLGDPRSGGVSPSDTSPLTQYSITPEEDWRGLHPKTIMAIKSLAGEWDGGETEGVSAEENMLYDRLSYLKRKEAAAAGHFAKIREIREEMLSIEETLLGMYDRPTPYDDKAAPEENFAMVELALVREILDADLDAIDRYSWSEARDEDHEEAWYANDGTRISVLWPSQAIEESFRRMHDADDMRYNDLKWLITETDRILGGRNILKDDSEKFLCDIRSNSKAIIWKGLDIIYGKDPYCIMLLKEIRIDMARYRWKRNGNGYCAWTRGGTIVYTPHCPSERSICHEAGHVRFNNLSLTQKEAFVHFINFYLTPCNWLRVHSILGEEPEHVDAVVNGLRLYGGDVGKERVVQELFALFYEDWVRGKDFGSVLLAGHYGSPEELAAADPLVRDVFLREEGAKIERWFDWHFGTAVNALDDPLVDDRTDAKAEYDEYWDYEESPSDDSDDLTGLALDALGDVSLGDTPPGTSDPLGDPRSGGVSPINPSPINPAISLCKRQIDEEFDGINKDEHLSKVETALKKLVKKFDEKLNRMSADKSIPIKEICDLRVYIFEKISGWVVKEPRYRLRRNKNRFAVILSGSFVRRDPVGLSGSDVDLSVIAAQSKDVKLARYVEYRIQRIFQRIGYDANSDATIFESTEDLKTLERGAPEYEDYMLEFSLNTRFVYGNKNIYEEALEYSKEYTKADPHDYVSVLHDNRYLLNKPPEFVLKTLMVNIQYMALILRATNHIPESNVFEVIAAAAGIIKEDGTRALTDKDAGKIKEAYEFAIRARTGLESYNDECALQARSHIDNVYRVACTLGIIGEKVMRDTLFIGIPTESSNPMDPKTFDLTAAVRKAVAGIGGVMIFHVADREALASIVAERGSSGAYAKAIYLDDTITASMINADPAYYTASIVLAKDSATREEMENLMDLIMKSLPSPAPADFVGALREATKTDPDISDDIDRLRAAVSKRKGRESVGNLYGGTAMDAPDLTSGKIVLATTEKIAESDIFTFEHMEETDPRAGRCFIYGDSINSPDGAKAFVRSCGYRGRLEDIAFIDKRGKAYEQLISEIAVATGAEPENIFIRAAEDERLSEGAMPLPGRLLEVRSVNVNGKDVYAAVNSYQTLIKIANKVAGMPDGMRIEGIVLPSGVTCVGGILKYLPKSLPLDYGIEIEAYRMAIRILAAAA